MDSNETETSTQCRPLTINPKHMPREACLLIYARLGRNAGRVGSFIFACRASSVRLAHLDHIAAFRYWFLLYGAGPTLAAGVHSMEWLPYAWPGLHINHMMPLAYDWADAPSDMQWLSVADISVRSIDWAEQQPPITRLDKGYSM